MNYSELDSTKKEQIKDYIKDNYEKAENKESAREQNQQIIAEVKRKFNCIINSDQIYEILSRVRKIREEIKEMNEELEEKKYDVDETHYIFNY